jgi:copper chaperone
MRHVTLKISGMSCDHCVRAVRSALADIPGVTVDQVSVGSATLRFDPATAKADQIVGAISESGYNVLEPVPW